VAGTLSNLGMRRAFTPAADFSGIVSEPLAISAVVHQALVEVDEVGTEAAAATGAVAVTAAMPEPTQPKVFRADHPFVFAIRNRTTGDVLFMGRVANPAE
jgi:serpin B